jgi:aryl-alcohol dehydrogenase-like predicted oxidoreductase
MRYVQLGKTDIKVSTIAFGGYAISGRPGEEPPSDDDAFGAIEAAFDEGVNFFVTADSEGDGLGERRLGSALSEVRDHVVLATKTGPENHPPRELGLAVDRSLANFGTDHIDLFMVDLPHPRLPAVDILAQLEKIREQGKIRAFGVCRYGPHNLARALKAPPPPCCAEVSYNLLFRAAEAELLPMCVKQQVSVLCRAPLLLGLLSGRYERPEDVPPRIARCRHFNHARAAAPHKQAGFEKETFDAIAMIRRISADLGEPMGSVALSWLGSQKGVASAIVGAENAMQSRRNARAGNLILPPGSVEELAKATKVLKDRMGRSVDMWEIPPRFD